LDGAVLRFNLISIPPRVDVASFSEAEDEINKHTTEEICEAYKRAAASGDIVVICHYPRGPFKDPGQDFSWYAYVANRAMSDVWLHSLSFPGDVPDQSERGSCLDVEGESLAGHKDKLDQVLHSLSQTWPSGAHWLSESQGTRAKKLFSKIDAALDFMVDDFNLYAYLQLSRSSKWSTQALEN